MGLFEDITKLPRKEKKVRTSQVMTVLQDEEVIKDLEKLLTVGKDGLPYSKAELVELINENNTLKLKEEEIYSKKEKKKVKAIPKVRIDQLNKVLTPKVEVKEEKKDTVIKL